MGLSNRKPITGGEEAVVSQNKFTMLTKRKTMGLSGQKPISGGEETVVTARTQNKFTKPKKAAEKFPCNLCDMTFFYKTSLATHQKNHAAGNTCQHCQRSFAIPTALFKHIRENCTKISTAERKKVLQNDEKSTDLNQTSRKISNPRTSKLKRRSTDQALLDLVYNSCSQSDLNRLQVPVKKLPPIKGIGNTPRKLIKCYNCGEKFKNPVAYATHAEHCVAHRGAENL